VLSMVHYFDLFGTMVFAIAGAAMAKKHQLNYFGVLALALITAMGGGSIRELLLESYPMFWHEDLTYLAIAAIAASIVYFISASINTKHSLFELCDAIGLASFTLVGVIATYETSESWLIVMAMGVLTGCGGGVLRDLLIGNSPAVLHEKLFVSASLSGTIVFMLCIGAGFGIGWITLCSTFTTVLALRTIAVLDLLPTSMNKPILANWR